MGKNSEKIYEKVRDDFNKFLEIHKDNSYKKLKDFFDIQKENFYEMKIAEFQLSGESKTNAIIKARQGWVSTIGRSLEIVIELLIEKFCFDNNLKITNDKILRGSNLNDELDTVKRKIVVDFGDTCLLPDGDIIIYKNKPEIIILAILSVKNSFRERYTETPYWKLKLASQNITKNIKVFMVTPDNDDEICFKSNKKSRIVMEYELDGIYLAKDKYDESKKIKGIEYLIEDLKDLL